MQTNSQITRQEKKYPADDRMFGKSFGKSLRKFLGENAKKGIALINYSFLRGRLENKELVKTF